MARLEPAAKGQDLLFETFSRPQWKTRSVQVNVYGVGPWENSLRRLAEKLCLKNVHFRGATSALIKGLRGDLFTEDEGMILKIREVPEPPAILHKLKPEV